jgi:hypothetical protein
MRCLKTLSFLCLIVFLSLFVSGCYDVKYEIISASEAVRIDALPKTYWTYTITAVANSNDYRFSSPAEKNSPTGSGYIRALPLKDDIYIVQIKADNYPNYVIMFFRLANGTGGKEIRLAFPTAAIEPSQYGVSTHTNNFYGITLVGSRENIMALLKAYSKVNFKDVLGEVAKIEAEFLNALPTGKGGVQNL